MDKLSDLSTSIPSEIDLVRYPHLSDIQLPIIDRDSVDLLIGLNHRVIHEIIEKREVRDDMLCAGKTVLGWFLYGPDKLSQNNEVDRVVMHSCSMIDDFDYCEHLDFRPPSINDDRATKLCKNVVQ